MTAVSASSASTLSEFDCLTASALLDAMPTAAIILDHAATLVAHNARAEELLQSHVVTTIGEIIGGRFRMMADRARRTAGIETSTWFEQTLGHKWYRVTVYPVRARIDGPILQVITATDITRKKHAEFEIRESEARLEEATRIGRLGTHKIYWDTEKVQWSPHMYVIHGQSPDSFSHSPANYLELVHPDDRDLYERYRRN